MALTLNGGGDFGPPLASEDCYGKFQGQVRGAIAEFLDKYNVWLLNKGCVATPIPQEIVDEFVS